MINSFETMADGRADHTTPPPLCNAVALNVKSAGGEKAIKITLYLGWSWLGWGGVGLARLHFWLQKGGFGLFGGDRVLVTH